MPLWKMGLPCEVKPSADVCRAAEFGRVPRPLRYPFSRSSALF